MPADALPTAPSRSSSSAGRRRPAARLDALLAAAVLLDALAEALAAPADDGQTAALALAGLLSAAGFALRTSRPVAAIATAFAGFAVALALAPAAADLVGPYAAPMLLMFLAQLRLEGRRAWLGAAAAIAPLLAGIAFDEAAAFPRSLIGGVGLYVAAPMLAASLARRHTRLGEELRQATAQLEADRAAHAAASAEAERMRVVDDLDRRLAGQLRQLADEARGVAGGVPAALRLDAVAERARDALDEVRRALGVLHDERPPRPPAGELAHGGADSGARGRARGRLTRGELAPALAVLAAGVADTLLSGDLRASRTIALAVALAAASALALRRRHPEAVAAIVIALATVQWSVFGTSGSLACLAALPIASFAIGAHTDGRRSWRGLALVVAGALPIAAASSPQDAFDVVVIVVLAAAGWGAGHEVGLRARTAQEQREVARRLADARALEAGRAAVSARRALAQDVHDVLAGALSAVILQARGATRLTDDPQAVALAAGRAGEAAASARDELDRLLGEAGDEQPETDGIPALVRRSAAAGLPVRLSVTGVRRALSPAAELAAYRLVQEALTNAMRHAGGAATEVTLAYGGDALRIVVGDAGAGPATTAVAVGHGGGFGLQGMRERVEAAGGRVWAGPRGAGWTVEASLPVAPPRAGES